MKRRLFLGCLATLAGVLVTTSAVAAPKKILVVTTTTGFRHSSIETAEKVIAEVGKSSGVYDIELANVTPPKNPGNAATDEQKAAFKAAQAGYQEKIKAVLAEKMSPAALKKYDGIIFANTTGDLPLPDREGFIAWVKNGGAFIGMHSATDTLHGPDGFPAYNEMIGAVFQGHGQQVTISAINKDSSHPATKHFGSTFDIGGKKEEIYLFKNYQQKAIRELLVLDKHPNSGVAGNFGVAWCREYGKGKVFYTSLGHNEYVWEMAEYQKHILGGIEWALGLKKGSAEPQAK